MTETITMWKNKAYLPDEVHGFETGAVSEVVT